MRAFADELLVLDDCSTDDTVAIARELGARGGAGGSGYTRRIKEAIGRV
ncbi:MAG: hypothetical protein L0Y55_14975 [Anaerolineales bacterium]|nr:hypothetical protein [Anaerolineales bacterium]